MSLKEELENSLLLRLCGAFAAGVALGWLVSQNIQASPRDRDIAVLKQRVDEKEKTINYLNAQDEPYRKQISQLLADQELLQKQANTMKALLETYNKSTDNNFKKWQEAEKAWIKNNDQLQKLVTSYSNNCSIISEIGVLDKRKAIFDENVRNGYSKYQLESNDLQARILSLQQHLTCQPQ